MFKHQFIFTPCSWIGEGTITLNMVEEDLNFFTKWNILDKDFSERIQSVQEIQIAGISENMHNELIFFDFTRNGFSVEMDNINIGRVVGEGIFDENIIAWEFRNNELNFEGFETYYKEKEEDSYKVHAEYVTSDQFRTQIDGRIWKPPYSSNMFDHNEKEGEE